MEIIRKTINLEKLKSHVPALVPYIRVEGFGKKEPALASNVNGDFGGIMCDLRQNGESTADLFNRYYTLKNILRSGEKYRKVVKGDEIYYTNRIGKYVRSIEFSPRNADDFTIVENGLMKQFRMDDTEITIVKSEDPEVEDETILGSVYADEQYIRLLPDKEYRKFKDLGGFATISRVEDLIGIVKVPSDIEGSKVPETFYLSQIEPWLDWFNRNHGYKYTIISKFVYDNANSEWKGTFSGGLPEKVRSDHPRYADVSISYPTETGIEIKHKYYRRIDAPPTDCCLLEEWNNRGGDKMWKFLQTKTGIYSQALDRWAERLENGDVLIPSISVPLLLTQNYEDNGVMSVYDETTPYIGNQGGEHEPYTDGVGSESKLQSLRTREKLFDDDGNVLPYIGNGDIPFKVNECKNMSFDESKNAYIGDYIRKITYYDENNETSSTITEGYIEFEYVIGGVYDPGASDRLSLNQATITTDSTEKTLSGPTLTASSGWAVISNSGSGWLTVSPMSGSGNAALSFDVSENEDTEQRVATIIIGTTDRSNYEEVVFSLIQLPAVTPVIASFAGSGPSKIEYGAVSGSTAGTGNSQQISENLTSIIKIKCTDSDWYVKTKPSFISLSMNGGEANTVYRVNVTCDPQEDSESPSRFGLVVFAATSDASVTYEVLVTQYSEDESGNNIFMVPSEATATIEYGLGNEKTWHVYYDEAHTKPVPRDKYDVVFIGGNPSIARVLKVDGSFSVTNLNETGFNKLISLKLINNSITSKEVYCGVSITLLPNPETIEPNISISISTTSSSLDYNAVATFDVSITSNNEAVLSSAWEVDCTADDDDVAIIKKSDTRFTLKNVNSTESSKLVQVTVRYTYSDEEIVSNSVSLLLKNLEKTVVRGELNIYSGYDAFVQFDVWPKCGDPAKSIRISGGKNTISAASWDPNVLYKDTEGIYCIKLTNPNYGYYSVTHVTLLDAIGKVVGQFGMQYNQVYEFNWGTFFGRIARLDVYVEP